MSEPLQQSLGYMANQAARLFVRELERAIAPLGLTHAHLPIIFALADTGSMTQKQLAQHAGVEQPTMAATLARMERDGLILRTPDPVDRRSAIITLTDLAVDNIAAVRTQMQRINALALSGLDAEDRPRFHAMLATVIATMDQRND